MTVRHGDSTVLGRVRGELDRSAELVSQGPTGVLYRAADLVVDGYEEAIGHINIDVDDIESQVFGAGEEDHADWLETQLELIRQVGEGLYLSQQIHEDD